MRALWLAAIALAAVSANATAVQSRTGGDWYRQARAWVESLLGERPRDREVIAPPANIDPQIALPPRGPRGTMRVIRPPTDPGR